MKTLTARGCEAAAEELASLSARRSAALAQKESRTWADGYGDHSAAINELATLDARIDRLRRLLGDVRVAGTIRTDGEIRYGSTVRWISDGVERTASILDPDEPDAASGAVSPRSPIGKALFGLRAGDTAEAMVAGREIRLDVLEVL